MDRDGRLKVGDRLLTVSDICFITSVTLEVFEMFPLCLSFILAIGQCCYWPDIVVYWHISVTFYATNL